MEHRGAEEEEGDPAACLQGLLEVHRNVSPNSLPAVKILGFGDAPDPKFIKTSRSASVLWAAMSVKHIFY